MPPKAGNTNASEIAAVVFPQAQSALRVMPIIPICTRLAYLQFAGGTRSDIDASLAIIDGAIPPHLQPENFVALIRRALVVDDDWHSLWSDSCSAYKAKEYVRGAILGIGAMGKAPVPQSLYMQVSIAAKSGWIFGTYVAIYRETSHRTAFCGVLEAKRSPIRSGCFELPNHTQSGNLNLPTGSP